MSLAHRLRRLILGVPIFGKLMGISVGLILLFTFVLSGVTQQLIPVFWMETVRPHLEEEAREVARRLQTSPQVQAEELEAILQQTNLHRLVAAVEIRDGEGKTLVWVTLTQNLRPEVLPLNQRIVAVPMDEERTLILYADVAPALHLRDRILGAQTKVAFGLAILALLVSGALSWTLVRPLRELLRSMEATTRGNLRDRLVPWADDEIGRLQRAYNQMVAALQARWQGELEARQELMRRNQQLSLLNTIQVFFRTTPQNPELALRRSLEAIQRTLGADRYWLFLSSAQGFSLVLSNNDLLPPEELRSWLDQCNCIPKTVPGQPTTFGRGRTPCPPTCPLPTEFRHRSHVVVPLLNTEGTPLGGLILDFDVPPGEADFPFLLTLGRQLGITLEHAQLLRELQQKGAIQRYLLRQLIQAQEEERRRISRELHDETGQALTYIMLSLKVAEQAPNLEEARKRVREVQQVTREALDRVRNLAVSLRPGVLEDLGLVAALEEYAHTVARKEGLQIDFLARNLEERLPPEVEVTVYRAVQEALTNVVRHARATRVEILLERKDGWIRAVVEDNGRGFDPEAVWNAPPSQRRLGLWGIRERVELLGGVLHVDSAPDEGTTLTLILPVHPSPEETSEGTVRQEIKETTEGG